MSVRKKVFFVGVALPMTLVAMPKVYAEDVYAGFTCGFVSTNDTTGVISQDPNKQTGEVNAGPYVFAHTAGGTIDSVTVTCCIKINTPVYGGGICRSATTPGNTGILVDTISYQAAPGDDVYIGTTVSWTSSKGGGTANYDCDETTPGEQACLATSVEA